jgi:tRNA nucleotidyltransferase (CCA-adding enzyme)
MAIKRPIVVSPGVRRLCEAVRAAGGRALVVGGTVRDAVLGRHAADVDLEVHGLEVPALRRVLQAWAPVSEVGRSFGVFKLRVDGAELDVALPRADSVGGPRRGVGGAPHIGVAAAARRRDLTINAMAWDPLAAVLVDPLGGAADAAAGVLRAADPDRFADDPLRVWRVARFAGVLGFAPDPGLVSLCRGLDLSGLPAERVRIELGKLLLGSPRPSEGWSVAVAVGATDAWVPGVDASVGPALDRAAALRGVAGRSPRPLALMLSVLLGAVGEPAATRVLEGLGIVKQDRFPVRDQVQVAVSSAPSLARRATDPALRRLADHAEVALCCHAAAALHPGGHAVDNLLQAAMLGVADAALPPLIHGRDLASLGVTRGPAFGALLAAVREAQLDGAITDQDGAMGLAGRLWSERPDGAPSA